MPLPFLETIGLTAKEADLYERLLRLGEVPANKLIKESKLKRATAYKSLHNLEAKGLVSHKEAGKILHFRPEPPANLLALADRMHEQYDRARDDLRRLMPELSSSYMFSVERPVVSTFEGVEGLKQIYEDTIHEGKPIYAVHQVEEIDKDLFTWLRHSYIPRRVKLDIHAYVIMSSGHEAIEYKERDKISNRTTIVVPQKDFPFQHEVNIYGDKIAFINAKAGTTLLGIVIYHPLTAKTMKSWFDLTWKGAQCLYPASRTDSTGSAK